MLPLQTIVAAGLLAWAPLSFSQQRGESAAPRIARRDALLTVGALAALPLSALPVRSLPPPPCSALPLARRTRTPVAPPEVRLQVYTAPIINP